MAEFIANFESFAAKELSSQQSTQSFDGTLRIDLDRVFVSRSEGDRIVERLRTLDPTRLMQAG
ncbi:hypothetical protein [Luteimonas sp. gir]|uniref:hypothetical protein n=1 Tax=Luteimonas sp. gir TaxID=3127960 RepID=UPI003075C8CB